MSQKPSRSVFSKLYRYYCHKLLGLLPQFLLLLFLALLYAYNLFRNFHNSVEVYQKLSWQDLFWKFFLVSLSQLWNSLFIFTSAVSQLVGFPGKLGLSFKIPKRSSVEDFQVVTLTPNIKRETMVIAKIAAIFPYFFGINLLINLPYFFYLLASLSYLSAFSFLLLNGIVFCLVNFLLLIPFLFCIYEGSALSILIMLIIIFVGGFSFYYFRESIDNYLYIIPFFTIPFSLLFGYLFYSLYRQKFLQRDLA